MNNIQKNMIPRLDLKKETFADGWFINNGYFMSVKYKKTNFDGIIGIHPSSLVHLKNGIIHNDNGPAVLNLHYSCALFMNNGQLHREDEPAMIDYVFGEFISIPQYLYSIPRCIELLKDTEIKKLHYFFQGFNREESEHNRYVNSLKIKNRLKKL